MDDLRAEENLTVPRRKLPMVGLLLSLVAVVAVTGAIVGIAYLAMTAMKTTDVYQLAWTKVRLDPQVIEALGEPVAEGLLASGEVHTDNDRGGAEISFDISGPKGAASVKAAGVRAESVWSLVSLKVVLPNRPEPLVLVAPDAMPEASAALPKGRQPDDTVWNARLANIPFKTLSHASRELELRGKSRDYIRSIFGEPTEIRTASFEQLKYGLPAKLSYHDEQWIYRRNMSHLMIFFQNELVIGAVEEWSDF